MKTAVVTGASGGIGSAIAQRLAADGFTVVVGYNRSVERADSGWWQNSPAHGHRAARISVLDPESLAGPSPHLGGIAGLAGRARQLRRCDSTGAP